MATIIGTSGADNLKGTGGDDLIIANGGMDILRGRAGADTYQLYFSKLPSGDESYFTINETRRGDAAVDRITGADRLVQTGLGGVLDYTRILRTGNMGQHLKIETASKPGYYFSAAIEPATIRVVNQYDAARPTAQVEKYIARDIEFNLLNSDVGTAFNDIMTGWKNADTILAGDGNDYISGGGMADILSGEAGNDIVFGNTGDDKLFGGSGADTMFGGAGKDSLFGGSEADHLEGGAGRDLLKGNGADDYLSGGAQRDRIFGGAGNDTLLGDSGNDRLSGGRGGDVYIFDSTQSGNDLIIDTGNAAGSRFGFVTWNMDVIRIDGFGSFDEALYGIDVQISGSDLVIRFENRAVSPGVIGQITVQNHFLGDTFALERITFGLDSTDRTLNILQLSGDAYTYSVHGGADIGGDDLVLGTDGDDHIYGGIGSDVMLGGAGADLFVFHDEEGNRGGTDLILDFNITEDILDFTEIKTLTRAGVTVTENSHGNAVISSIYGAIELNGVSQADVTDSLFAFL